MWDLARGTAKSVFRHRKVIGMLAHETRKGIFKHTSGEVLSALAGDGKRALYLCKEDLGRYGVFLWDLEHNALLHQALLMRGTRSVSYRDGRLLSAELDPLGFLLKRDLRIRRQEIFLRDFDNMKRSRVLRSQDDDIKWPHKVAVTENGKLAMSVTRTRITLWDLDTGSFRILEGPGEDVSVLALHEDGKYAVTGSPKKNLALWDLELGRIVATFTSEAEISACAFVGGTVLAGDTRGNVHILAWET
jgi:hypothetical protein